MATYQSGQWKWGGLHTWSVVGTSFQTLWSVPAGQMWYIANIQLFGMLENTTDGGGTAYFAPTANHGQTVTQWYHRAAKFAADGNLHVISGGGFAVPTMNFSTGQNYGSEFSGGDQWVSPKFVPTDNPSPGQLGDFWQPGEYFQSRLVSNTNFAKPGALYYWYLEI